MLRNTVKPHNASVRGAKNAQYFCVPAEGVFTDLFVHRGWGSGLGPGLSLLTPCACSTSFSPAGSKGFLAHNWSCKSYLMGYNVCMKRIQSTNQFTKWLDRLKDVSGRARIQTRIQRLALG